jgi:hypothetical protein
LEHGIALERGAIFRRLPLAKSDLATLVTGLVEDRDGNIWINGTRALARVPAADISSTASNPAQSLTAREFREGEYRGSDPFIYIRNAAQMDRHRKTLVRHGERCDLHCSATPGQAITRSPALHSFDIC